MAFRTNDYALRKTGVELLHISNLRDRALELEGVGRGQTRRWPPDASRPVHEGAAAAGGEGGKSHGECVAHLTGRGGGGCAAALVTTPGAMCRVLALIEAR